VSGLATSTWPLDRADWLELVPMVTRIARIDATTAVRLIDADDGRRTALARLPSGGLVARTIASSPAAERSDVTARADQLEHWLIDADGEPPARADSSWRGARPPQSGWEVIDRVPATVVVELVRAGAQAHVDAADQGLGARAVDTLLDTPVLTVTDGTRTAAVTNRSLSALVAMGFLPADGYVVVSVSRGWTRIAGEFGSAYAEPVGMGLTLL
jgi:hypothetical protein